MIRKEDLGTLSTAPPSQPQPWPSSQVGWVKAWLDIDQMLYPASPSICNSLGCGPPLPSPQAGLPTWKTTPVHLPRPHTLLVVKVMPSGPHVKLSSSHQRWLHVNLILISINSIRLNDFVPFNTAYSHNTPIILQQD